ncbi:MAG: GGDEF domain-containing protein [Nitrosomonas sp.]|nr:GGDEF domain-containing protein [Nitrosomonas sp.]MBP7113507.1 GGDEF domain-containing protein [Nitrosomonas sp.]
MEKRILQSVINMTEQRDVDSLEYGVVVTLAELLPLNSISLYKLVGDKPEDGIEEVICLFAGENGEIQARYKQNNEVNIVKENQYLYSCLLDRKEVLYKNGNGQTHMISPLICDKKIIGAIEIASNKDLKKFKELINGITRIYENYLYILNKSERDKLTGLLNRHSFDTKFSRLLQIQKDEKQSDSKSQVTNERRQQATDSHAWLAIIDIDHFKNVNDKFGHVCGDEVLLMLSQRMKAFFRSSDLLFRFGGEEFVIILEPIPHEMAERTLERFRNKVADSNFPLIEKITISGGYIKITDLHYPVTLIERADQALYYAKKNGRNCMYSYESLVERGELSVQIESGKIDLF